MYHEAQGQKDNMYTLQHTYFITITVYLFLKINFLTVNKL